MGKLLFGSMARFRSSLSGEAIVGNQVWNAYPRIVNRMLMRRSAPQPRSRKTPRGGRMTARMILQMSLFSNHISGVFYIFATYSDAQRHCLSTKRAVHESDES